MMNFFVEGGWVMWPILAFGLLTLWAAGSYAANPRGTRLTLPVALGATTALAGMHGMLLDVSAVLQYVQEPARVADHEITRVLLVGLMESTRPGGLAGLFVVLAGALVSVGTWRLGRPDPTPG